MSYKHSAGRMSLRKLLAALNHAQQTCLADTAVQVLVVGVIRTLMAFSLSNTGNAQRIAADALQLVTTLAGDFVMMAMTVGFVHHVAR